MAKKITNIQTVLNSNLDSRSDNLNLAIVTSPRIPQPVDPVKQQLSTKYIQNGLTVTSNNTSIHPRDEAGNIILQENSEQNPLLIIEPTATKVSVNSMLRVLDTRFEYYKFPVIRVDVPESPELDLSDLLLEIEPPDAFYARYKPSADLELQGAGSNAVASGILLDDVVAGLPQTNVNSYTVNQIVKDSGKKLRVRANIKHLFTGEDVTVTQDDPLTPFTNEALQSNPSAGNIGYVYFYVARDKGGFSLDREFAGPFVSRVDPSGQIIRGETLNVNIDFEIDNNDFGVGTTFGITAKTGQASGHIIVADNTYFSVTEGGKNVNDFNEPV